MNFEAGKTYKTRDGRDARIYATDGKDVTPIHGAVDSGDGWEVCVWKPTGKHFCEKGADLMPPKKKAWVNIYPGGAGVAYDERASADGNCDCNRIACVEIEYHEGEGL